MTAEAAKMEAIQQEWDAAAERIRAEDPGFDIKMALADPDFAQTRTISFTVTFIPAVN